MHTSLEIAHIYGDQKFSDETKRGLEYARHIIENYEGDRISTVILVDDVHAEMKLDVEDYVRRVQLEGVIVDNVIMESHMMTGALELLGRLTMPLLSQPFDRGKRIQKGVEDEDERWIALTNDAIPTCALLSGAFHLTRFGTNAKYDNVGPADRIINILPQKYMPIEEKALFIIKNSIHADLAPKIDYIFHG